MVLIWLLVWVIVGIIGGFPHISFNHPDAWSVSLAITMYLSLSEK